jgi:hypothetical protein
VSVIHTEEGHQSQEEEIKPLKDDSLSDNNNFFEGAKGEIETEEDTAQPNKKRN